MGAIWRGRKQYFIEFTSDKYNRGMYNPLTDSYGCYEHTGGNASSLKSAKAIIKNLKKLYAEDNPRNFKVYDSYADIDIKTNHVPCVYEEE